MALLQNYKKCKQLVSTRSAQGHECARNGTVRNVWRAPVPDPFSLHYVMFKIYSDSYGLARTCPPDPTARNVWRASLFHSVELFGGPLWPLGPPRSPMATRKLRDDPAERPFGLPKSPGYAFQTLLRDARGFILTSGWVSSP